jgi:hypothetical protein
MRNQKKDFRCRYVTWILVCGCWEMCQVPSEELQLLPSFSGAERQDWGLAMSSYEDINGFRIYPKFLAVSKVGYGWYDVGTPAVEQRHRLYVGEKQVEVVNGAVLRMPPHSSFSPAIRHVQILALRVRTISWLGGYHCSVSTRSQRRSYHYIGMNSLYRTATLSSPQLSICNFKSGLNTAIAQTTSPLITKKPRLPSHGCMLS